MMRFLVLGAMFFISLGKMVSCLMAVPSREAFKDEDEFYECFVGVHCLLGEEVLKEALGCLSLLNEEALERTLGWMTESGFENQDLTLTGTAASVCQKPDDVKREGYNAAAPKFVQYNAEVCKVPESRECQSCNEIMECYIKIYTREKPINNCGYPLA